MRKRTPGVNQQTHPDKGLSVREKKPESTMPFPGLEKSRTDGRTVRVVELMGSFVPPRACPLSPKIKSGDELFGRFDP